MANIASELLTRSLPHGGGIARLLRSPALEAILGAHLIVAAIILARSHGWLQPLELLIYDALRVA
jgi:CHASE2 domain-containing sensor protein